MKSFAEIKDNKVLNVVDFKNEPSFEPEKGQWVDVTGKKVGKGDSYDPDTGVFTKPEPAQEEPVVEVDIATMTEKEFWKLMLEGQGYKIKK